MNKRDLVSGLFWLAAAIFVLTQALDLGVGTVSAPGAGFVLFWSSVLFGLLSIILVVKALVASSGKQGIAELWHGLSWGNVVIAVVALVLYSLVLVKVGFVIATTAFMAVLYAVGRMKVWVVVVSALVTVALTYAIFHYALQIEFPRGPFRW
ncbi:MAG TPA: tripartite tricarboxylate transporter TctB family protein [Syntrophorhabdales bacterium]|nr:tripartite tricarboxylate transporter TctB family protein [Syntrophorhabdales bacterium]